ncbi:MAG: hypothetical protein ACTHJ0_00215, partial [Flavipsychrobacter sp.]
MTRKFSIHILFLSFLLLGIAPAMAQQSQSMSILATAETETPDELYYDAVKQVMLRNDKNAQYLFGEFLKVKPDDA